MVPGFVLINLPQAELEGRTVETAGIHARYLPRHFDQHRLEIDNRGNFEIHFRRSGVQKHELYIQLNTMILY
jgi:hypothetical protein